MDKDLRISELEERVAQLEAELLSTKEHLKRYTSPANSKELYEKNKEVHKQRVKDYQKRTNYKSNYQPTPEQKKEYEGLYPLSYFTILYIELCLYNFSKQ